MAISLQKYLTCVTRIDIKDNILSILERRDLMSKKREDKRLNNKSHSLRQ